MHAEHDEFLAALDGVVDAIRENIKRGESIIERADAIRRQREAGRSYRDIVPGEQRPLILEMISESINALYASGNEVRRAEARALKAEGMSTGQIAEQFNVTRQRVWVLLRDPQEHDG